MVKQFDKRSKWWGWGREDEAYHIPDPDRFWTYVRGRLGKTTPRPRVRSLAEFKLRKSRLPERDIAELRQVSDADAVSTDGEERAFFSLGKSYTDLVRMRRGEVSNATDAIVRPGDEQQVLAVMRLAARRRLAVIPFGGGTSVVGGVEPAGEVPTITIDMAALNQVLEIDREAATATVQAGVMGPDLERVLKRSGFTLWHFPQSFRYSSVGGWIATRSAGQNSTKYGAIAALVQSVRLAHPEGILSTPNVPAAAAGPDLVQMIVGSEGTLGVITQANLRLSALPEHRSYKGYLLPSFATGVQAADRSKLYWCHDVLGREPEDYLSAIEGLADRQVLREMVYELYSVQSIEKLKFDRVGKAIRSASASLVVWQIIVVLTFFL